MLTVKVNGTPIGTVQDARGIDEVIHRIIRQAKQSEKVKGLVSVVFEDEHGRSVRLVGFHV